MLAPMSWEALCRGETSLGVLPAQHGLGMCENSVSAAIPSV